MNISSYVIKCTANSLSMTVGVSTVEFWVGNPGAKLDEIIRDVKKIL